MVFLVAIQTTNDAFNDRFELPRILRELADRLDNDQVEGRLRDINGNMVGSFCFQPLDRRS
jgi:hypothetical protein